MHLCISAVRCQHLHCALKCLLQMKAMFCFTISFQELCTATLPQNLTMPCRLAADVGALQQCQKLDCARCCLYMSRSSSALLEPHFLTTQIFRQKYGNNVFCLSKSLQTSTSQQRTETAASKRDATSIPENPHCSHTSCMVCFQSDVAATTLPPGLEGVWADQAPPLQGPPRPRLTVSDTHAKHQKLGISAQKLKPCTNARCC